MRMQYRGRIFGMELRADIPALVRYFYDFYQIGSRIDACTLHASSLKLIQIAIIKLIAMAMAFFYKQRVGSIF